MNKHKKLVLSLYRLHLRFCIKELKYEPFDWRDINEIILYDYQKMNRKKRINIIKNLNQKDLGAYAANTIRHIYKTNKNLEDKNCINSIIDYGFHVVRNPYLFYRFEKTFLEDMYIYY